MSIVLGQKLYAGNWSRNEVSQITEYIVSKIGKKYFFVEDNERLKFDIETLKHTDKNYSQYNVQLYLTEQEIKDKNEMNVLRNKFILASRRKPEDFSLDQLRRIIDIIDENK